jgi:hypothetical protein
MKHFLNKISSSTEQILEKKKKKTSKTLNVDLGKN